MKPDETETDAGVAPPPSLVVGDPIGTTVYSERFVLRLLLKLQDLTADEAALEEDLCVLWDMTAEKDVVEFLLRHDFLEHVRFAWPHVPSPRIAEIFLGVLSNMCCYPSAVRELRSSEEFCSTVVQLVHSDDTLLLVQVMRLIKACLYRGGSVEATRWLCLFSAADFPPALAFILTNSSNKELLCAALETLNVICSTCNMDSTRVEFVKQFVTSEVVDGVHECAEELGVTQKSECDRDELERAFLVALEVTMNLAGFDVSHKLYEDRKKQVSHMMCSILEYYKVKTVEEKEVGSCLVDIVDYIITISDQLGLHDDGNTDKCLKSAHEIWSHACSKKVRLMQSNSEFEELAEGIEELVNNLNKKLCSFVCGFIKSCPEEDLERTLNMIGEDLDEFFLAVKEDNSLLHSCVTKRLHDYKMRHNDE